MLVANFMRFRRKRLEKQIDNFSLKKKSETNLFRLFVPFYVSVHYWKSLKKKRKTENN